MRTRTRREKIQHRAEWVRERVNWLISRPECASTTREKAVQANHEYDQLAGYAPVHFKTFDATITRTGDQ